MTRQNKMSGLHSIKGHCNIVLLNFSVLHFNDKQTKIRFMSLTVHGNQSDADDSTNLTMFPYTTLAQKVLRLILYLGLSKCWATGGKGVTLILPVIMKA
jgi:hypothetical protein